MSPRTTPIPVPPPLWGSWGRFSHWLARTPLVVWTLVTISLVSSVAGYVYWYGDEILAAPLHLWPFIPDSPLSATLWAFALIALHRRGRADLLGLLACMGAVKYGLWTDWVWFVARLSGEPYTLERVVLSLNHFGMMLEGLALLPLLAPRLPQTLAVVAWYAMNDYVDYGLGYYPRGPRLEELPAIRAFALATTGALTVIWLGLTAVRWFRPHPRRDTG